MATQEQQTITDVSTTEDLIIFNRMRIMLKDQLNLATFPKMNVTKTDAATVISIVIPKN